MSSYQLTKIKEYDAHGGPASDVQGADGHPQTATRAGRFVIHSIGKHVSSGKYAFWSGIPWGAEMNEINGVTMVKKDGKWLRLSSVNKTLGAYKNAEATLTRYIKEEYFSYYKKYAVPPRWIFNEFGHTAVKYFADRNNNWRLDKNESVLGDFIHTTPPDEYLTSINRAQQIVLSESHGCIHVKPLDIDTMIGNGYLKKGNTIEVHPYNERTIAVSLLRKIAREPFEVHFYPGIYKIAIYRVALKK